MLSKKRVCAAKKQGRLDAKWAEKMPKEEGERQHTRSAQGPKAAIGAPFLFVSACFVEKRPYICMLFATLRKTKAKIKSINKIDKCKTKDLLKQLLFC